MKHIISALVENKPGVLAHVAGMFAARAFNIDSLVVGRTEDPELSRMTIVVIGDDRVLEQVRKQLAKIVPVVKVQDFVGQPVVARDLMLIAISAWDKECRADGNDSDATPREDGLRAYPNNLICYGRLRSSMPRRQGLI